MEFIINEEQINFILQRLGEIPAKISFDAISLLKSLPRRVENEHKQNPINAGASNCGNPAI